jgi:hypothetical protein
MSAARGLVAFGFGMTGQPVALPDSLRRLVFDVLPGSYVPSALRSERARREQVRFGACLAEPLWDSQARHLDRITPPALNVPR